VNDFLEHCYGSWFTPQETFERLALDPPVIQAAVVVAGVNLLEGLRLGGGIYPFFQVLGGGLGWAILNGLLWGLLTLVGQNLSYSRLLTLTGFASLPWLLVPAAQLLGGPVGELCILLLLVWFVALQTWAVSVATALDWWRIALLLPMTFVGALVALNWTLNSLVTTAGLSS
jgi:hypothetical protein